MSFITPLPSSHRTCRFPASGGPIDVHRRHAQEVVQHHVTVESTLSAYRSSRNFDSKEVDSAAGFAVADAGRAYVSRTNSIYGRLDAGILARNSSPSHVVSDSESQPELAGVESNVWSSSLCEHLPKPVPGISPRETVSDTS